MKKFTFLLCVFCTAFLSAQNPMTGTKAWTINHQQRNSDPAVQNGNDSLGFLYDTTLCGLNYTQASVKLGQRSSIGGAVQPAAFPIANIHFCGQVNKAYLWCVAAGNGIPVTATITNPAGGSSNFPMSIVGQAQDMCWGYAGTYTYRADITSIINGNGNYIVSGLPTAASTSGNDMDGATMMIIYNDAYATYTGSIHIDDGCLVSAGAPLSHTMTGFNSCANSSSANGFMVVADLQGLATNFTVNNGSPFTVTEDWWNFISESTSITQSQASCNYSTTSFSDCFCLAVVGLYTQTACNTCVPSTSALNVSVASVTNATCNNNGAATIAVTGGSGNYVINWVTNPIQTGLTATGLGAGNYYVNVYDSVAGACGAVTVPVTTTGPVLTMSSTNVACSTLGSASVNVTGGVAPYTYSWAPTGGNAATATNLSAGNYTVTVTDNNGCIVTAPVTVQNTSNMQVSINTLPDSCPSPTGVAQVYVTGGQAPISYHWMPGNQTSPTVGSLVAGTYTLDVTDGTGCTITSLVTINAVTTPMTVSVSGNTTGCGNPVQLFASTNYYPATFVWQPSSSFNNPNSAFPYATAYANTTFTVTATSQCGTATDTCVVTLNGINSLNEQICFVTVDTAINKNVIIWERLNSPVAGSYNIYRETSSAGVYALIGTQPVSQFSTFTDMTANPLNYASRYRISTVDSCGIESDTSAHHRTLFLQVSPSIPSGFNLAWTAYEGLTIPTYNVYRGPDPSNMTLIGSVPGTTYNYTDPNPPAGSIYYIVQAVHPNGGCTPLRLANPAVASVSGSLSNYVPVNGVGVNENTLFENSLTVTPNPGNGNFQISMSLTHAQEIQIVVVDNLGRKVYAQNENANAGTFIGTMNLEMLSSGVYFVQVKTANGSATKRLIVE
jgi:hypothetical protein